MKTLNCTCVAILLLLSTSSFGQSPVQSKSVTAADTTAASAYSSSLPEAPSDLLIARANALEPLPNVALEPSPAGILSPVAVSKQVTSDRPQPLHSKRWWSLTAAEHGAAFFDAWSTRQAIGRGAVELNPSLKPFANSAAIYPAAQIFPAGMDFLSMKLMRSNHPILRKLWWVPQTASAISSFSAGIHNQRVLR